MYSKLQDGSFIISGYVPRDAELKTVGEKKSSLCRWSVKVGEKKNGDEKEAIWTNCQAWHNLARCAAAIKKGDIVLCVGKIEINQGNDGREYKNLVCEFVSIVKSVPKPETIVPNPANESLGDLSDYEEILDDGDVPF